MFAIKKINQYFHLTGKGQIHSGITLAVFAMSESPKFHQITKKIQISYRKKERSIGIMKHSTFF